MRLSLGPGHRGVESSPSVRLSSHKKLTRFLRVIWEGEGRKLAAFWGGFWGSLLIAPPFSISPLLRASDLWSFAQKCRAKFYIPPPPHHWKYPSGRGGIKGGAYKISSAGGFGIYIPPSPEKCFLARRGGGGKGGKAGTGGGGVLTCPACRVPLHKLHRVAFCRPKHSQTISACKQRKGRKVSRCIAQREREQIGKTQQLSLSTSDPTVTGRSLVSGQFDDSL